VTPSGNKTWQAQSQSVLRTQPAGRPSDSNQPVAAQSHKEGALSTQKRGASKIEASNSLAFIKARRVPMNHFVETKCFEQYSFLDLNLFHFSQSNVSHAVGLHEKWNCEAPGNRVISGERLGNRSPNLLTLQLIGTS
jgi:hypothetical protein